MHVARKIPLVLLMLTMFALTGVAFAQSSGDVERGGELYVEYCAMCHGVDGRGRLGASLDLFPGIQAETTMAQVIREGVEGSAMPAWGQEEGGPFSDQDIQDVTAYVLALVGGTGSIEPLPTYEPPEIEPLPEVEGDPSQGAVVFEANCAACHGEQAQGKFGWPLAKSWPGNQPAAYIHQVISKGIEGSIMPGWDETEGGPLGEDEIDDVTAYILSLSPAPAPTPTTPPPEGPLGRTTSLLLLGGLSVLVLIILYVYYRRA
jgi:cytochrome c oxidase cbb3-type subunit 3